MLTIGLQHLIMSSSRRIWLQPLLASCHTNPPIMTLNWGKKRYCVLEVIR